MTVGIPSFTLTITVRKNCIFGKQILSILTIDIVLHIHVLVHLCILMAALLVAVLLLVSIASTCAIKCGRVLRVYRAPPGGSLVRFEFSLQSFAPVLKGSHVKWFTDNQDAARIVEVGSMKLELHRMARRIFDNCVQSGIYLDIQWIPRTLNQQADYISRLIDIDDWQTTDDLFCP